VFEDRWRDYFDFLDDFKEYLGEDDDDRVIEAGDDDDNEDDWFDDDDSADNTGKLKPKPKSKPKSKPKLLPFNFKGLNEGQGIYNMTRLINVKKSNDRVICKTRETKCYS